MRETMDQTSSLGFWIASNLHLTVPGEPIAEEFFHARGKFSAIVLIAEFADGFGLGRIGEDGIGNGA